MTKYSDFSILRHRSKYFIRKFSELWVLTIKISIFSSQNQVIWKFLVAVPGRPPPVFVVPQKCTRTFPLSFYIFPWHIFRAVHFVPPEKKTSEFCIFSKKTKKLKQLKSIVIVDHVTLRPFGSLFLRLGLLLAAWWRHQPPLLTNSHSRPSSSQNRIARESKWLTEEPKYNSGLQIQHFLPK